MAGKFSYAYFALAMLTEDNISSSKPEAISSAVFMAWLYMKSPSSKTAFAQVEQMLQMYLANLIKALNKVSPIYKKGALLLIT